MPFGGLVGKEESAQESSTTIHDLACPSVYGDIHNREPNY